MQRRNFVAALGMALAGWLSKVTPASAAAATAETQETKKPAEHKRDVARQHTEWLDKVMQETRTVRVGMTRADLAKVFTTEGGIYTRTQRLYVYRECPYIKVKVCFRAVPERRDKEGRILGREAPEDIITEISLPFLDYSTFD